MINWFNSILAGIISGVVATVIFVILTKLIGFIGSQLKYRKLIGEYEVFRKSREDTTDLEKFEKIPSIIIENNRGNKLIVRGKHKGASDAIGTIIMHPHLPNHGSGEYQHEDSKDGWGSWDIRIATASKERIEILVYVRYQYKQQAHYPAYHWLKIKN